MYKRHETILNLYKKTYMFRFCLEDEADLLMNFVDQHWRKGHILSTSKKLLDWQYLDKKNKRYHFILAISKETKEIHGILGFIPTNLFDSGIKSPMRWGAVWKIREDVASKGLGLAMKFFMYQSAPAPYWGGIGLSKYSKQINSKMGEEMGIMNHYWLLNPYMETFKLVSGVTEKMRPCNTKESDAADNHFTQIHGKEFLSYSQRVASFIPDYKSMQYYVKRFFEHPFYQYHCIACQNDSNETGLFFYRLCCHDGASCIMIVDFVGNEKCFDGAKADFYTLLKQHNAEYLSFYEYGLSDKWLESAGLHLFQKDDEIILPLFYEPFEQKNVQIDFHYMNEEGRLPQKFFFKGDADQDRPNEGV